MYGVAAESFLIGKRCGKHDFWLDEVVCEGTEMKLLDCMHDEVGIHNCDWQRECVHVFCHGAGPQAPGYVLGQSETGILTIDYNEDHKELCDANFT